MYTLASSLLHIISIFYMIDVIHIFFLPYESGCNRTMCYFEWLAFLTHFEKKKKKTKALF